MVVTGATSGSSDVTSEDFSIIFSSVSDYINWSSYVSNRSFDTSTIKDKYDLSVGSLIAMTWNLSGKMVESCSCNMLCPCWFGVKELMIMDKGYCASSILFSIQNGSSDGIDLKGNEVVMALDFPGPTLFDVTLPLAYT